MVDWLLSAAGATVIQLSDNNTPMASHDFVRRLVLRHSLGYRTRGQEQRDDNAQCQRDAPAHGNSLNAHGAPGLVIDYPTAEQPPINLEAYEKCERSPK